MAEIEKKYSDFQQNECNEAEQPEIIDEKICPTCEPDPSFKLEKDWWEIKKAYLNESVCEYRVRVYESEALTEDPETDDIPGTAMDVGVLKILAEYGKPFDDGIKMQLRNATSIVDTYYNVGSALLGVAYLVSVPAFNFDQIDPDPTADSPDSPDADDEPSFEKSEFIIQEEDLFRKIHFLRLTLKTYSSFYGLVQLSSDSYVIRQEDDIVKRINYDATERKIKLFSKNLNDVLNDSGYPDIGGMGLLKNKQLKRLKFTFKAGNSPFELDKIYAMSEQCPDKYEELTVGPNNFLRNIDNEVVYNFYKNIDSVYNDITSKETMPWAEWTIKHFYPKYIIDTGDIEGALGDRSGLGCLLEETLGMGQGNQIFDSLAREIMSAFDLIEMDYNTKACRELERLSEANERQGSGDNVSLYEERKEKMLARYQEEFKNKAIDQGVGILNNYYEEFNGFRQEIVTRDNYFKHANDKQEGHYDYWNRIVSIEYTFKNHTTKQKETKLFTAPLETVKDLEEQSLKYAYSKFTDLEQGGFSNTIANSPHYHEAQEALKQVYKTKGNFIDDIKDSVSGVGDFELLDLIPIIGLCGMSKLTGKALSCLTNGISFDSFLDMLISKSFEYMKMNTLDKFYNDLPYSFREQLQAAIEKEFGPDVDLSDLFGIKMADGGDEKLKEFIKSKFVAKRIKELC